MRGLPSGSDAGAPTARAGAPARRPFAGRRSHATPFPRRGAGQSRRVL